MKLRISLHVAPPLPLTCLASIAGCPAARMGLISLAVRRYLKNGANTWIHNIRKQDARLDVSTDGTPKTWWYTKHGIRPVGLGVPSFEHEIRVLAAARTYDCGGGQLCSATISLETTREVEP